ncbi:MAG TPA: hypothetical protein VHT71_07250 [Methylomirabilota bacterium]|nr:hypothetical protein [Methylomirabilota bacterium]
MTRLRVALWVLLAGKLLGAWGLTWDIQWHLLIGRDTFWIPPHLMMYGGIIAGLLFVVAVLGLDTIDAQRGRPPRGSVTILGLTSTRGVHLAVWGIALLILAAPIDDLWHRLFGLDVTLWSPPHLLGLLGSAINTLGTLLIALDAYPAGGRARWAALVLGGGLLYGGVRVVLEPSWLTAYTRGGIAFHTFAILGALLLPLALLPAARLLDRRWAPVLVVVAALAITFVGEQIARAGFALVQPVSVLGEAIQKDPDSPIALAAAIRAKSRGAGMPMPVRLLLPVVAAAVMGALDVRRRPALASAGYGVMLLILYGWSTSRSPAFAPLVPSAFETAAALLLVIVAAIASAMVARRLADALEPPAAVAMPPGALTSPAR